MNLSLEATVGEIVPFKKKEQGPSPKPKEQLSDPENFSFEIILHTLIRSTSSESNGEESVQMTLLRMNSFLSSLRGRISNNALALRREGLREFTLEELHEIAQKSNQAQWQQHPTYFRALIAEIRSRPKAD